MTARKYGALSAAESLQAAVLGARRLASLGCSVAAMERKHLRTQLRMILDDPDDVALVEAAIVRAPRALGAEAPAVAVELLKMGLPAYDMPHALEAAGRIVERLGSQPMAAAEFVGTLAATTGLRGQRR